VTLLNVLRGSNWCIDNSTHRVVEKKESVGTGLYPGFHFSGEVDQID
jgi:hypothetical protein